MKGQQDSGIGPVADAAPAGFVHSPDRAVGTPTARADATIVRSFGRDGISPVDWNSLLARCDATVYSTHEWQSLWWEFFGAGRELHIIRFAVDGEIAGIAPFFAERGNAPGTRRLRFIGSGDAFTKSGGLLRDDGPGDYLDVLADPDYARPVAEAFVRFLAGSAGSIDRIDLVNLREDGCFMRIIAPALAGGPFAPEIRDADRCPYIPVEPDTEGFLKGLDAGARRRYGQAFRLVKSPEAPLRRTTNDPASWDGFFDDMVRLHQERWNRAGFPGQFFDERNAGFQRRVAEAFARNGWLWYSGLYDGAACVAARLGFVFRGRMYDYLSGFDEESPRARKRPGLGLLLAMYDDARARGVKRLDLLRGEEAYKFELTGRTVLIRNATIRVTAPRWPAGRPLSALLAGTEMLLFLARRETRLFSVQMRRHGATRAIGRYLDFRTARLRNKLHPVNTAAAHQRPKGDPTE